MDIKEELLQSIENVLEYRGLHMEVSPKMKSGFFNIEEEIKNDNVRIVATFKSYDNYLFLNKFIDMLKNNEISIVSNKDNVDLNK